MASDINIKTNKARPAPPKRWGGRLTLRILAINLVVPVTLLLSLLFMGHYRNNLIAAEAEGLATQTRLFAATLTDNAQRTHPVPHDKMLQNFAQITGTSVALIDDQNQIIERIPKTTAGQSVLTDTLIKNHAATPTGLERLPNKRLLITASTTINGTDLRLISIRETSALNKALIQLQFDILTIFVALLGMTLLLSVYLAETISQPLTRLAQAATSITKSRSKNEIMPYLSDRQDEIGTLSLTLQDMTAALQNRIDATEAFAADVAHELKNPLTSLRSAIETLDKVKNAQDRTRLMAIIHHDIDRMNRLITDISGASRLDAALERETMEPCALPSVLERLVTAYNRDAQHKIILNGTQNNTLMIEGNPDRLEQVFANLIDNALSFSAPGSAITITVETNSDSCITTISDQGPGLPAGKEEAIFERFYSERPDHEDYGYHSGLGLSIARTIIQAHNGDITAENIYDDHQQITGARFIVRLPLYKKQG